MRRRKLHQKSKMSSEFELDLAPLLAVMVKLVPVLLISSAFVQIMVVETDLPQAVKEAVQTSNDPNKDLASIQVAVSMKEGLKVIVSKQGDQKVDVIPLTSDGHFDFPGLHKKLQTVKAENPKVFRLELSPQGNVPYNEIVKVMDEARKSRDKDVRFPVWDSTKNIEVQTDYMFPDVVFENVMEG